MSSNKNTPAPEQQAAEEETSERDAIGDRLQFIKCKYDEGAATTDDVEELLVMLDQALRLTAPATPAPEQQAATGEWTARDAQRLHDVLIEQTGVSHSPFEHEDFLNALNTCERTQYRLTAPATIEPGKALVDGDLVYAWYEAIRGRAYGDIKAALEMTFKRLRAEGGERG